MVNIASEVKTEILDKVKKGEPVKSLAEKYGLKLPSKDEALKDRIVKVLDKHQSYGHRRIALELGENKKRTRRVMKLYGIKPYKRKARWHKRRDD